MLQQSSRESVMYGLCRGVSLECLDERLIIYKIILYCLTQIGIFNLAYIAKQFPVHSLRTFLAGGHVVRRHILVFLRLADLLDIELEVFLLYTSSLSASAARTMYVQLHRTQSAVQAAEGEPEVISYKILQNKLPPAL